MKWARLDFGALTLGAQHVDVILSITGSEFCFYKFSLSGPPKETITAPLISPSPPQLPSLLTLSGFMCWCQRIALVPFLILVNSKSVGFVFTVQGS